jgi:hypothetical protein
MGTSWFPGPLSVVGCLEIAQYRCLYLVGNVAGFWTDREKLLGTGGNAKAKGQSESSFLILCPNKSCFVTILQIM